MSERKEDFVLVTKDLEKAKALRSEIGKNYSHIWTCVWNMGDEFKVSVATVWDGSLPPALLSEIRGFATKFENPDDLKEEPKEAN